MGKSVLVLCCEGFEEIEALTVVDVLRRAGVTVTLCSAEGRELMKGSHNIYVKSDKLFGEAEKEGRGYDAVVLPGGLPNAYTLRDSSDVVACVKKFAEDGKLVCAICAAPCVLERAGLLGGRKATSYPGMVKKESCGAYLEDKVVRDGKIITSRGPGTALPFSYEILRALGLEADADKLEKNMIYKV
ncbi:MAG: DJ-1/PfpI family protein [Clostridia bacterium]|nr:DJ-1/PfpI family protein [Clostridia bacterium]